MIDRERIIPVEQPEPASPILPEASRILHRDAIRHTLQALYNSQALSLSPTDADTLLSRKAENALLVYIHWFEQNNFEGIKGVTEELQIPPESFTKYQFWVQDHAAEIWDSYYDIYTKLREERNLVPAAQGKIGASREFLKDPTFVQELTVLRAAGVKKQEIASRLGVELNVLTYIIRNLQNEGVLQNKRRTFTDEEKRDFLQKIIQLRQQEISDKKIAKRLKISTRTIIAFAGRKK